MTRKDHVFVLIDRQDAALENASTTVQQCDTRSGGSYQRSIMQADSATIIHDPYVLHRGHIFFCKESLIAEFVLGRGECGKDSVKVWCAATFQREEPPTAGFRLGQAPFPRGTEAE